MKGSQVLRSVFGTVAACCLMVSSFGGSAPVEAAAACCDPCCQPCCDPCCDPCCEPTCCQPCCDPCCCLNACKIAVIAGGVALGAVFGAIAGNQRGHKGDPGIPGNAGTPGNSGPIGNTGPSPCNANNQEQVTFKGVAVTLDPATLGAGDVISFGVTPNDPTLNQVLTGITNASGLQTILFDLFGLPPVFPACEGDYFVVVQTTTVGAGGTVDLTVIVDGTNGLAIPLVAVPTVQDEQATVAIFSIGPTGLQP